MGGMGGGMYGMGAWRHGHGRNVCFNKIALVSAWERISLGSASKNRNTKHPD
jgi:hypothetical protein